MRHIPHNCKRIMPECALRQGYRPAGVPGADLTFQQIQPNLVHVSGNSQHRCVPPWGRRLLASWCVWNKQVQVNCPCVATCWPCQSASVLFGTKQTGRFCWLLQSHSPCTSTDPNHMCMCLCPSGVQDNEYVYMFNSGPEEPFVDGTVGTQTAFATEHTSQV